MSTAIAAPGSSPKALARAPCRPISSCTEATARTRRRRAARLGDAARRLEHDVGADPVVHRPRGEAAARELSGAVEHHPVADPDERARLVRVVGAEVDMEVIVLDRRAVLQVLSGASRSAREHARHLRPVVENEDALADQHLGVVAADDREREQPRSSTCVIASPISSTWPISAIVGPLPRPATRANDEPIASVVTSANADAARRQTSAAGVS